MALDDSTILDPRPSPQISLGIICAVGLTISGILLFIATYDFYRLVHRPLGVGMAAVMVMLFSAAARVVVEIFHPDAREPATAPPWVRETLIAAVPLALLSSRLSCMGLGLVGCSPMCNFLASAWLIMIFTGALIYLLNPRTAVLVALAAACLAFLIPNCTCDNALNHRWIARIGYSPVCFAPGVAVALLCIATLHTGRFARLAAITAWLTISAAIGFFVTHHFFHYPW